MTTTTEILLVTEQEALDHHEAIIARGVQTFIEVGESLAAIRDGRLYRAGYGTFEDYCRDRWGIGSARARQLIGASAVAQHIESVTTVTLSNEAQARPLVGLVPDQQAAAAYRATEIAGKGAPTAKHFQQAAAEIAAPFWQSLSPAHPTAHLWTQTGPASYRSACGITTMGSGAAMSGSTEAGHCSSCVRATWIDAPSEPPLPSDYTNVMSRLGAQGVELTSYVRDGHRWYTTERPGKTGIATLTWSNVTDRLAHLEQAAVPAEQPAEHEIVAKIRAQASALGLLLIWEDDTVILYWPEEDIDQLLGMGYADALHWLATEGAHQAEERAKLIVGQRENPHQADPKEPPRAPDLEVEMEIKRLCAISGSKYLGVPTLPYPTATRYRIAKFSGGGGDYLADEALEQLRADAAKAQIVTSDSKKHKAEEQADQRWLDTAEVEIASGNINYARQLLSRVSEASAYRRDRMLSQLPAPDGPREKARAFLAEQRERLKKFSQAAMVSQTTYKQALDHIEALLGVAP